MSDGITDMYREMEQGERALRFLDMFAVYVLDGLKPDRKMIECAMAAGDMSRRLLGHFGWTGKDHEKDCKEKLATCFEKLKAKDPTEWALFAQIWLPERGSNETWEKLMEISPFKGSMVTTITRHWGRIQVGAGLGDMLWDKAKAMDWQGLAVMKISDVKVIPAIKERNSRY